MEIEGHCQDCGCYFDAHWSQFDGVCPNCASIRVLITTDETDDYRRDQYEARHNID